MKHFLIVLLTFVSFSVYSQCEDGNIILNGDFETGDFSNWVTMDITTQFVPQQVICVPDVTIGFGFDPISPIDGTCMSFNGFDGGGPGEITMHQEVTIPADAASATLAWSEWLAWDLMNFAPMALDRMFEVQIQPQGGGAALEVLYTVTAPSQTIENGTGWVSNTADLSAYAGQTIWVCFVEDIPEFFTGPAQAAVDGVSLEIVCSGPDVVDAIPTMGEWGLMCLGLMFMIVGIVAIKQPKEKSVFA